MVKITEFKIGDFKGVLYQYKLGYGYKIYLHDTVVDRSYVYLKDLSFAYNKMVDNLKLCSGFSKDLFERLK